MTTASSSIEQSAKELGQAFNINTIAVIGLGLIGGSFALAMQQAGLCHTILGYSRSIHTAERAKESGVIDEVADLEQIAQRADLIFIAVPVNAYGPIFQKLKPHLNDSVIITDGGSTKENIIVTAQQVLGERVSQFIPAHPIAGSHESGLAAAKADLFLNRRVVLTPLPNNNADQVATLAQLWQKLGSRIKQMDAAEHDKTFAVTSHFPHLVAAAYMHLFETQDEQNLLNMAGTGFRDFSRIAASSPEMWNDIFKSNKKAILQQLSSFQEQLDLAKNFLKQDNYEAMLQWYTKASDLRKQWQENPN